MSRDCWRKQVPPVCGWNMNMADGMRNKNLDKRHCNLRELTYAIKIKFYPLSS